MIPQGRGSKTPHPILQAAVTEMDPQVRTVWLAARRPPLSAHPLFWRTLARWVYKHIHWTPDYGIEYLGVFTEEGAARHAASCDGGFVMEVPWNDSLPEETCQFGKHDFPLSEASAEYRNRRLSFVAVHRDRLDEKVEHLRSLEDRLSDLNDCIEGKCVKAI